MSKESSSISEISGSYDSNEYKRRTYEDLSQEFEKLYPAAARAFELVPQMYNRLTLVDELTHKEAVTKIHNDHQHLAGFTERNIRRYLPTDNPNLPRRVRTPCPKNSITKISSKEFVSNAKQDDKDVLKEQKTSNDILEDVSDDKRSGIPDSLGRIEPVIEKRLQTNESSNDNQTRNKFDIIDFEFHLKWEHLVNYLNRLSNLGTSVEVWFNGELDRRTGKIITAYTGTIAERY
ncbi:MAG: hypothetical protein DLM72_08405 [Candidatus Nitrosopolaris wilkensis]|nr:MAG: hypothetical protein DLM72_08405 [Candidatus Nitrosopolaris wilkensis]